MGYEREEGVGHRLHPSPTTSGGRGCFGSAMGDPGVALGRMTRGDGAFGYSDVRKVWWLILLRLAPFNLVPRGIESVQEWWLHMKGQLPREKWIDALFALIAWQLWKEWKERVFQNDEIKSATLLYTIMFEGDTRSLPRQSTWVVCLASNISLHIAL